MFTGSQLSSGVRFNHKYPHDIHRSLNSNILCGEFPICPSLWSLHSEAADPQTNPPCWIKGENNQRKGGGRVMVHWTYWLGIYGGVGWGLHGFMMTPPPPSSYVLNGRYFHLPRAVYIHLWRYRELVTDFVSIHFLGWFYRAQLPKVLGCHENFQIPLW